MPRIWFRMQHKRLTNSRIKLPNISMSSILLKFKYKVSMTWRRLLAHNVRVVKCNTVDNIHSKVVLRFELKPLDSESNVLFKLKRLLLFPLNILDSRCACIRTTLIHRNKFGKATMKLESSKEIPDRISTRFAKQAYTSRLIDKSKISWLPEINWIFEEELLLIFRNFCCKTLSTIYYYVDCLEWVYSLSTTLDNLHRKGSIPIGTQALNSKSNFLTTRL